MSDELVLLSKSDLREIVDSSVKNALAPKCVPFDPKLNIDDPVGLAQKLWAYYPRFKALRTRKYGEWRTVKEFGPSRTSPSITEFVGAKDTLTANDLAMEEEQTMRICERLERQIHQISELLYMVDSAMDYGCSSFDYASQIFSYVTREGHNFEEAMEHFNIGSKSGVFFYTNRVWAEVAAYMFPEYVINECVWPYMTTDKPKRKKAVRPTIFDSQE